MFKVVWVARFREGMMRDQGSAYWTDVHAPLGLKVDALKGYVQNHVVGTIGATGISDAERAFDVVLLERAVLGPEVGGRPGNRDDALGRAFDPHEEERPLAPPVHGDGFELDARSPLLSPGVNLKAGDYVLAVAGQPVRTDQDIQALLIDTAAQRKRLWPLVVDLYGGYQDYPVRTDRKIPLVILKPRSS